jgi:hypothetical protein
MRRVIMSGPPWLYMNPPEEIFPWTYRGSTDLARSDLRKSARIIIPALFILYSLFIEL